MRIPTPPERIILSVATKKPHRSPCGLAGGRADARLREAYYGRSVGPLDCQDLASLDPVPPHLFNHATNVEASAWTLSFRPRGSWSLAMVDPVQAWNFHIIGRPTLLTSFGIIRPSGFSKVIVACELTTQHQCRMHISIAMFPVAPNLRSRPTCMLPAHRERQVRFPPT